MSRIIQAEITKTEELISGVYKLCLTMPADYEAPNPGQFVNVYLDDNSRLLPRPLSVCDWEKPVLTLVYAVVGEGTKQLSAYLQGQKFRVSTPLGNGYNFEAGVGYTLVGGGLGVPPLLYAAKTLHRTGATVCAALGFSGEPFLVEEFPCPVQIATDNGSAGFRGNVVALLRQSENEKDTTLLACGPKPMLKALAAFAEERGVALQVSLEERMGCGYGACVGCVCETKVGHKKVCEDGPVFDAKEVLF